MTEFKKGDVCSLEVTVIGEGLAPGSIEVQLPGNTSRLFPVFAFPLIRRAPVDLATCDLSEPVSVYGTASGRHGQLLWRDGHQGWVAFPGGRETVDLANLRPADTPAPAAEAGEVERLRARVVQLESALGDYTDSHPLLREALASTARACAEKAAPINGQLLAALKALRLQALQSELNSHEHKWGIEAIELANAAIHNAETSCPPGHIMIGDRAVPEPMREAPEVYVKIWMADPSAIMHVNWAYWNGSALQRERLARGLIHSTESAAIAHAEALVALSAKREG